MLYCRLRGSFSAIFCPMFKAFLPEIQSATTTSETAESANSLPFERNGCLFMWGAYFCIGAYKRNVVVVINIGAYIHGVLILYGCLFCVK